MHILVIPSERYLPKDRPLEGIFQKDNAVALRDSGLTVGILSIELHGIRKMIGQRRFFVHDRVVHTKEEGITVSRISAIAPPNRYPRIFRPFWVLKGKQVFKEYVKTYGMPDVIHAHNALNAGLLALELKKEYKLPYVVTEHSSQFIKGAFTPWEKRKIHTVFSHADALIAVSPSLGEVIKRYLSSHQTVSVVPNPLDRLFENDTRLKNRAEGVVFFSLAALVATKGFFELLESFAKSFQGDSAKKLVIGGDGPERDSLEQYASELGIEKQVTFVGLLSKKEVKRHMEACDVFVLASHFETFGVVITEALACGKPVVATQCGGPEYLIDDSNGLLVPPKETGALAVALQKMANSFDSYDGKAIRMACLHRYGSAKIASVLQSIYNKLLEH
ncbi:glycosyltransferase [Sulfurimonas diazotrophicus]|uniref:Glycosyltransferase n=1 Tax=Sulfurimonas diazotrophicus TaxID=3131939 RepID=A0ABZ3H8Y4_9BACT